jgi:hypothetical protein
MNHLPERDVIELFSLVLLELRNLDPCFDHYNLYRLCNSYHTLLRRYIHYGSCEKHFDHSLFVKIGMNIEELIRHTQRTS